MHRFAIEKIKALPKPIAIVGMGITGTSVLKLLELCQIPQTQLLIYDDKKSFSAFSSGEELIKKGQPKTLVVSPGVPLSTPWIQKAIQEQGCVLTSELDLAYLFLQKEKIVAITGSIGKSTTTSIIHHGLSAFIPHVFAGGNLGIPLAQYVCELIEKKVEPAEWLVLELSSYQLENFKGLNAAYSIFTYFTANHLERYSDKSSYYQSKWNLLKQTSNAVILNSQSSELKEWATEHPIQLPHFWVNRESLLLTTYDLKNCQLLGSHNQDNLALAAQFLKCIEAPDNAFYALKTFKGLPHRLENLGTLQDVRYVNDSKATTMESVLQAVQSTLETVPKDKHLWLLLGGKDKNLPWEDLKILKNESQLKFLFFGECRSIAQKKSQLLGLEFLNLKSLCSELKTLPKSGDTVLLSPGGTSLDEFKGFEDRGHFFKTSVFSH